MWASTLVVAVAAVIYTSIVSNGSIDIGDVDKQLIMTLIRYMNEIVLCTYTQNLWQSFIIFVFKFSKRTPYFKIIYKFVPYKSLLFSFQYYDNIVSSFTIKSRFIHIFKNLIVTFYTIILFSQLFLRLNKLYGKNV